MTAIYFSVGGMGLDPDQEQEDKENRRITDKLFVNRDGLIRLMPDRKKTIKLKAFNMLKKHQRIKPAIIKMPNGRKVQGIIMPPKMSKKVLALGAEKIKDVVIPRVLSASGYSVLASLSMQPGTGSGRPSSPAVGGMRKPTLDGAKKILSADLRERYPEYFQYRPIPATNIREAIDPYPFNIRNQFTNAARTDPTMAPAIRKRVNAFFRNGFTLELEVKDKRSPVTNIRMDDKQLEVYHQQIYQRYHIILRTLEAWTEGHSIKLLKMVKKSYHTGCVQGRFLARFFPPLEFLKPGRLPEFIKVLSAEETHNVVMDRLTEQIVAVRIASIDEEKYTLLPDEIVYGHVNDSALTKYESLYGRSDMEPVIQLARLNKFITNVAYQKAVVAAYLPKVLASIPLPEAEADEKTQILKERAEALDNPDASLMLFESSEHTEFQSYPQMVNQEMITAIRRDIDEICLGAIGSTKAQISRTENLTRDNATIQEIENERNVITPDENAYAEFYETQLLNPLFAHLCGTPEEYLDVRVIIKRIPDKEDVLEKINKSYDKKDGNGDGPKNPWQRQNDLQKDKEEDIATGALQQEDATTSLGASGMTAIDKLSANIAKLIELMEKPSPKTETTGEEKPIKPMEETTT